VNSPFDSVPAPPPREKLRAEALFATRGTTPLLRGINLGIPEKKVTTIIGPSGCGKSTFVRCLNRMHETEPGATTRGSVLLDGRDIYADDVDPIYLRRRVGMVFSKPNLFPELSVLDNLLFGVRLAGDLPEDLGPFAERLLRRVDLWSELRGRLEEGPEDLPYGVQQRLCVARALALAPEVLLLDEPCSVLDPVATSRVEELIHELGEDYTLVVVTHSMQQAARISDYTAFFDQGELVEFDETDVVFTKPSDPRTEDYITGRFG